MRIVVGPEGKVSQVVLPLRKQNETCRLAYDSYGHQGPERILQTLRKRFFSPGMHHDVFDYSRRCHRCRVAKARAQTTFRASAHITANHPLEMIAIDFTQMEMSSDGRDTVIVITDVISKWAMEVPVRDQTVSPSLESWSKNGSQYLALQLGSIQTRDENSRPKFKRLSLATSSEIRVSSHPGSNEYRDDTTKDHGQKLHVRDKVLLRKHPPAHNKLQAIYHDSLYTVVATPEVAGTYIVQNVVTQATRIVTASELCLHLASKTEQVGAHAVTKMDVDNDVTVPDTQSGTEQHEDGG
ncbi:Pol polyprotein [Plakobranchus ocellatus]|uniref:Pol polyprotein n=1 Tax=Plakobranchus ocellatus TaxID=259542 RepID=A0AAV4BH80_9GAST|nr:Pol polyprotein [Plakobranchus ocellatus]